MITFALPLLSFFALTAEAKPVALAVRYREGSASFTKTFTTPPVGFVNETGVLKAGAARRRFIANLMPFAHEDGTVDSQFQFEFSPQDGAGGTVLQVQGSVFLKKGVSVTVLDCGRWKVDIGLAPLGEPDPGFLAVLGNQRVTTAFSDRGETTSCRMVVEADTQSNLTLGAVEMEDDPRPGQLTLSLKTVLLSGKPHIRYRVEHTPAGGKPWALKSTTAVTPGERTDVAESGGRLGFLFEGGEAAWARAAERGSSESPPRLKPVAEPKTGAPVKYARYRDAYTAFDMPEGWSVEKAGEGEDGNYGFQMRAPAALPNAQALGGFAFTYSVDRAKDAPDGDFAAMLRRDMGRGVSKDWTTQETVVSRTLTEPAIVKVLGGVCWGRVDESLASECENMEEGARVARADCYSVFHHAQCVSEKGFRIAIQSPLGYSHAQAGRLTGFERETQSMAERRLKSFEFVGKVPRAAFISPKSKKR